MASARTSTAEPAVRGADDVRTPLLRATEADRRLESWIIEQIEDGHEPPSPATWATRRTIEADALAMGPQAQPPGTGQGPHIRPWKRIRLCKQNDVIVITLVDSQLLNESSLAELRSELRDLRSLECDRWILSLANVDRVSSQFLEILVALDRHCSRRPGGRLKLCKLGPDLVRLLEISGLDQRFEIATDVRAALQGGWPQGHSRVPVELLDELSHRPRSSPVERATPADLPTLDATTSAVDRSVLLVIRGEGQEPRSRPIPEQGLRLGRALPSEVILPDPAVSRTHAWIGPRDGGIVLEDLGSTNGTRIDGRLLRAEAIPARIGSAIEIGRYRLELVDPSEPMLDAIFTEWVAEEEDPELGTVPLVGSPGAERSDPAAGALQSVEIEGVFILTPTIARLEDESSIDPIRAELDALLERAGPSPRIVVNLAPLITLSGRAIGLFLAHHLRLRRAGGNMRLAQPSAAVATAMEVVGLPRLIEIHPTIEDAVLARWPD